jgi:hypothetical protein
MYKLINIKDTQYVMLSLENLVIPFDPANTDYQKYLEWLAEGNTPEPADEPEGE